MNIEVQLEAINKVPFVLHMADHNVLESDRCAEYLESIVKFIKESFREGLEGVG